MTKTQTRDRRAQFAGLDILRRPTLIDPTSPIERKPSLSGRTCRQAIAESGPQGRPSRATSRRPFVRPGGLPGLAGQA